MRSQERFASRKKKKKSGFHCWVETINLIKKVSEVSRLGGSETGLKASQGVRDLEGVETRGSSLEKTVCKEGLGKGLCQRMRVQDF